MVSYLLSLTAVIVNLVLILIVMDNGLLPAGELVLLSVEVAGLNPYGNGEGSLTYNRSPPPRRRARRLNPYCNG